MLTDQEIAAIAAGWHNREKRESIVGFHKFVTPQTDIESAIREALARAAESLNGLIEAAEAILLDYAGVTREEEPLIDSLRKSLALLKRGSTE